MMQDLFNNLFGPYAGYSQVQIYLEVIAAILGITSVLFAARGNIWVYPTGIISTAIYVYLLYQFGLYGDMGINAYYFAMSIYGWYNWTHASSEEESLPITWAGNKNNLIGIGILVVFFPLFALFLDNFTDSTVPWIDGFTTAIFLVGMWFMAKKNVENWIYWIVGDLISIPLYHYKGLTLTAFQYFFFLFLAVAGLMAWIKKAQPSHASAT